MSSWDLEHYVGHDEGEMVENTLEMMKTRYFHQRHPGYPGLLFYIQMVPATAHLLLAAAQGKAASIRELPREGFYRAIRRLTLLAGWIASIVTYFIGRRWLGRLPSVLAGSLVALSPLALRESGVVNPDLLLTFFVAIGLWLSLRVVEEPVARNFTWAGAWVGLAAAIKYTGALLAAAYVLAWLLCETPRRTVSRAALGAGLAAVAFILTSPYTLLDLPNTIRGLGMHVGYYQAAEMNAPGALSRILATSGVGLIAALAAFAGSVRILSRLERSGLVILSFPLAYFILFSFFQRAFPRHALVLLPAAALLAARGVQWILEPRARYRWLSYVAFAVIVAQPLTASLRLGLAARRVTPADRAAEWIEDNVPDGSRILEDQFTPRIDPSRYRVHRLRVEEKVFAGNYEYVLHSGYPPGLPTRGLRPIARFEPEGSLGAGVTVYQVPDRDVLMGVTLPRNDPGAVLRAGQLPYFGEGWLAPKGGAFGTLRLSNASSSEMFFVSDWEEPYSLQASMRGASAKPGGAALGLRVELNGRAVADIELAGEGPKDYDFSIPRGEVREGLNRIVFHYEERVRLSRRHREAALAFYSLKLERDEEKAANERN
jgi:hypothetical protein